MTGTTIVAVAGAVVMLALIGVAGFQVFASAGAADAHLTRATASPPPVVRGAAGALPTPTGAADDGAQQIFVQLQQYYAANAKQGTTIFWATLLAMCLGFAIVFVGVVVAGINSTTAIVAAIAGVLSQFIAATFLVALRSTQQQGTAYAQGLVQLRERDLLRLADERSTQLGLNLLEQISSDRSNPANATKAAIATGLIVRQPPTIVESPGVAVGASLESSVERRVQGATVTFGDTGIPERRAP